MARAKARADGLIERTKTYDGKRVHFYGKTAKEVAAKIDEYERQREAVKENGPLFEDVAGEWWETHSKNIKTGAERAYKGSYKAALEEFTTLRMFCAADARGPRPLCPARCTPGCPSSAPRMRAARWRRPRWDVC